MIVLADPIVNWSSQPLGRELLDLHEVHCDNIRDIIVDLTEAGVDSKTVNEAITTYIERTNAWRK